MTRASKLQHLRRLVGTWTSEATHPARPGVVVHGTVVFEWLPGEQFLIQRSTSDQPEFPGALTVTGFVDRDRAEPGDEAASLTMHYYDTRGVFRTFGVEIDDHTWRMSNESPGFAQRFTGTFADGGSRIDLVTQLCTDGRTWNDDLKATYRRR